jgi:general secretion pathway protein L
MLQEFARWYGRQMAALLPSLAAPRETAPNGLVIAAEMARPEAPAVRFLVRRAGRETALDRFTLDAGGLSAARGALSGRRLAPAFLRLPPGLLLERTVTLPLAAEPSLERVVHYELDRYTPFAADEVFWSAQVRSRDRAQARMQVAVTLVPRATLAPLLAPLRALGITPLALEGQVAGGFLRRVPLAVEAAERKARRARRVAWAAAAGCFVLALVAIGLPFLLLSQTQAAIEDQVAALQPRMTQAEAIRQSLAARGAGSDAIAAEQAQVADPLQAIAALTQILPDDTFLTALVLQKRDVTIEGQSANAARLIGLLSNDPVIRNAAFAAPVTRNDTGADLFSIKAEVRP